MRPSLRPRTDVATKLSVRNRIWKGVTSMADEIALSDELRIKQHRPSLDKLPPQVAERIRDMWRVGGMVSGFTYNSRRHERLKQARDRQHSLFGKARRLCRNLLLPPGVCRPEAIANFETELKALDEEYWEMPSIDAESGPFGSVEVDRLVSVTDNDSARLARECEIAFMHAALELMPKGDKCEVEKIPLLHCFRRLRNVVLHYRQLDVRQEEVKAKLIDDDKPGRQIAMLITDSWFLIVKPEDMEATRGESAPALFSWFRAICDKYPAWFLLQAA